jgi:hypothetical protein
MELRRGSDLAIIMSEVECTRAGALASTVGLADVAELCRRCALSHPGLDWNERRDQILSIAVEWDLGGRDALDAQSDACLRSIALFLG